MNITGILEDAALVSFIGIDDAQLVCGTIVKDHARRWPSGYLIRTSKVVKVEGDIVTTLNSRYKIVGGLEEVTLSWQAYHLLLDFPVQILKSMLDGGCTIKEGMLHMPPSDDKGYAQ